VSSTFFVAVFFFFLLKLRSGASPSLFVPLLLLKLAYNGDQGLELRRKVGKLRTARGQKTSQILGPRHAKVLLASGETTSDDNDLAMASSSFKGPGRSNTGTCSSRDGRG